MVGYSVGDSVGDSVLWIEVVGSKVGSGVGSGVVSGIGSVAGASSTLGVGRDVGCGVVSSPIPLVWMGKGVGRRDGSAVGGKVGRDDVGRGVVDINATGLA